MIKFKRLRDHVLVLVGIVALGSGSSASAALVLQGGFSGSPGQELEVSLVATADMEVFDLFIDPVFPSFLALQDFERPAAWDAFCNDAIGVCSVFADNPIDPIPILAGTVARWTLKVDPNADPTAVPQPQGAINFGISLDGVDLDNEDLGLPPNEKFLVVEQSIPEVPEPSTYLTLAIGLGALAAFLRRRDRHLATPA